MLLRLRTVACLAVFALPACVVKLVDRNSAADNGAVTGAAANCAEVTPPPRGAPGGPAEIKFVGRYYFPPADPPETPAPQTPFFDWSGNYITARFEGTDRVTIKLALVGQPTPDGKYTVVQDQMFEFVVDNIPSTTRQITVQKDPTGKPTLTPLEEYDIVGLAPGPHEVTIHKNTEAQKGAIQFKGIDLHGGTLLPPTRRARRMEFIGDSIICGYGNEGKNATCPFEVKVRDVKDPATNAPLLGPDGKPIVVTVPVTENQYRAFTSIAARDLDADFVTLCWSGKGVYKNYKERTVIDPVSQQVRPEDDATTTVPELWEKRTLASDFEGSQRSAADGGNMWDFATEKPEEVPQVVVISLGTNDFSRDTLPYKPPGELPGDNVPDGDLNNPAELENFYRKYLELVQKVRQHRPGAHIFIATPPMVTDQFPLEDARRKLQGVLLRIVADQERAGDRQVYKMDLVEQGFRYGLGCDYHPNLEVHRIMARQLVGAIRSKTCW